MLDLPQNTRVRILDPGPDHFKLGLFVEADHVKKWYLIDVGYSRLKVQMIERFIPDAEPNIVVPVGSRPTMPKPEVETKRRGPKPGTKYKTQTTRVTEERPAEDTRPEPMHACSPSINDQEQPTTPVAGRIAQLETVETRTTTTEVSKPIPHLVKPEFTPPSPPLLIIVQPDGTTILSTPVTKDNVTGLIRSLIDLVS